MANFRNLITAEDRTKQAFDSVLRNADSTAKAFVALRRAIPIAATTAFTASAIRQADEINKLSDRLGVSTEALSEYEHVAELTGVSFKNLTDGFQRAGRRINEAAMNTGEARFAIAELGLAAEELTKLPLDQQFEAIAEAMEGVESQTDKLRIAQKLFDSENVRLLQTMTRGADGIRDMREEARELGRSLSQEAADGASDALDAWTRLAAGSKALGIVLVETLGPAINDVLRWLGESLPSIADFAKKEFNLLTLALLEDSKNIKTGFSALFDIVAEVAETLDLGVLEFSARKAAENLAAGADEAKEKIKELQMEIDAAAAGTETSGRKQISFQETYNGLLLSQEEIIKRTTRTRSDSRSLQDKEEERRLEKIKQYLESLKTENELLGLNTQEVVRYELAKLGAQEKTILAAEAIQEEIDAFEALQEVERENEEIMARSQELVKQQAEEQQRAWERTSATISRAFTSAIQRAETFNDVLDNLLGVAIQLAQQAIFKQLAGEDGQGLFGEAIGNAFQGLFANGGSFSAGRPIVVGERGPEIISPQRGGTVSNMMRVEVNIAGGGDPFRNNLSRNEFAAQLGDRISRGISRGR